MVGYFSSWDYSPDPARFAFNIVPGSVLSTWLYNNTDRSVLAAIPFHFVGNATGQLLELSPTAERYQAVITIALVLVVPLRWGPVDVRCSDDRARPPY
ncbi:hypothetical protein [Halopiger aswanensis]|nr:hypothetical protein [Halopiger aswanensis]